MEPSAAPSVTSKSSSAAGTAANNTKRKRAGAKPKRDWKALAPESGLLSEREYTRWVARGKQLAAAGTAMNRVFLNDKDRQCKTRFTVKHTFYDIERGVETLVRRCADRDIDKTSVDNMILALQALKRLVPERAAPE